MTRLIPPVALPVGATTIAATVLGVAGRSRASFGELLADRFGASRADLFGSGRAALAALFAASRDDERDEVHLPGYTCWSVAAAAVRAGMRVRLFDVDPRDFLPAELPATSERTAAVVFADLLSAAAPNQQLAENLARARPDVLVVLDHAQSWPQRLAPGAVGLLSFARGKPMPLGGGGALLYRDDGLGSARRTVARAVTPGGWQRAAALAATAVLGRPAVFRIPESIPALGIGRTEFDPTFAEEPFREWQARLGIVLLRRMTELHALRARHAQRLAQHVAAAPGWRVAPFGGAPIRLGVLAPDRGSRDRVVAALRRRGVSAAPLYPSALVDVPALRPYLVPPLPACPGSREIADRLLTLPVYPTLSPAELESVGRAFTAAAGEAA